MYGYFRRWLLSGLWNRLWKALREQVRASGANAAAQGSDHRFAIGQDDLKRGQRGYDAGKKTKGRKRHIAVDTQGWLLAVNVHSAGIQDRIGARAVLMRLFATFTTSPRHWQYSGPCSKISISPIPPSIDQTVALGA